MTFHGELRSISFQPPELLAAILTQCEEFSRDQWPDAKSPELESQEDAWRNDRRSGMEGVPSLYVLVDQSPGSIFLIAKIRIPSESFMTTFLPPLTLQPPVQFGKTVVAKKMSASVRLTKNLPMTKQSPMSRYLVARDSSAWETAVKQKREVVMDDIPAGWRILEKDTSPTINNDVNKGKKTSRIFSFWGRRESSVPRTSTTSPAPDAKNQNTAGEHTRSASLGNSSIVPSRGSQDSVQSAPRASVDKTTTTTSPSVPIAPNLASSTVDVSPQVPQSNAMSSYSTAPDPVPEPSQAPSAVSRFFGRFSRGKSSPSTTRHNSLALSSDDIEFLSDIVPSANDDSEDQPSLDLLSLGNAIKPDNLPLPPVLPPPPSAPPVQALATTAESQPPSVAPLEGFDSLLGSLELASKPVTSATSSTLASTSILQPSLLPTTITSSRPVTPAISSLTNYSKRDSSPSPLSAFALPPPPSSRPHTPAQIAPPRLSPPPVSKLSFPPTFVIPPPPSMQRLRIPDASSPTSIHTSSESSGSPGSARPLSELYPNAFPAKNPVVTAPSRTSSPFALPPPSRTFTPNGSSDVTVPTLPAPLAPPPRSQPLSSGLVASNVLDDDDDFAEFHTSPTSSHGLSPVGVTPSSSIPLSSAFSLSSLPPSSIFKQPTEQQPPKTQNVLPADDDEFSDFHSSSSVAYQVADHPSDQSLLGGTTSTEKFLQTPRKPSGFTTTGSSSSLGTPSPPRPPSKDRPQSPIEEESKDSVGPLHSRRRSRVLESQHQHTLSLMSLAASRPGRWPAPPSPLPQILSFPAPPGSSSKQPNLMDEDASTDADPFGSSISSPVLLNPTPSSQQGQALGLQTFAPLAPSVRTSTGNSTPTLGGSPIDLLASSSAHSNKSPTVTTGASVNSSGLSAQDLSFFEGL